MEALNMSKTPLTSIEVTWKSLYIPVLPKDMILDGKELFDEASMKEFFENKCLLGKVERVDYVSKSDYVVSVFVHFEYWFENSRHFIQMMSREKSEYKLTGYFTSNGHFHEIVSKNNIRTSRYISVRINKTPIPSVQVPELNIHQLVASNKFMENLIEEQKVKMEQMQAEIES